MAEETGVCAVCGGSSAGLAELRPVAGLMAGTAEALAAAGPLPPDALVCRDDRARGRRSHVERLLEQERGVLGELDREVLESIDGLPVAEDVEAVFEERRGFGERASDVAGVASAAPGRSSSCSCWCWWSGLR